MEFDAGRHVTAVSRGVESREKDGAEARVVVARRRYQTRIEDLWDALTNAERIPRWFLPVTGDLKPGGRYQLQGNAGGTIETCEPPRRLEVTWEFGGHTSWVVVTLREAGEEATELELEHIAHTGPEADAFWEQFGPGAVGVGWDLSLLGLALHAETGWDKPPETDATFHMRPDGRAFIEGSSAAWGEASHAFGTDPEAARGAAERTRAFYTGETPPES